MTFRTRRQNAIRRRQIELVEEHGRRHGRRKISATTTAREDRAGAINAISPRRFSRNPFIAPFTLFVCVHFRRSCFRGVRGRANTRFQHVFLL